MAPDDNQDDQTRSFIALTAGVMVAHYRIIDKIGTGGMGEVYLAEDTKLRRKVALKFLPPHFCQDEECRMRFKREAQAAAKLSHPNIITVFETSEHQGRPFFAMEHVEGQSLRDLVEGKELTPNQVSRLAIQLCEGLCEAHDAGVVHRDIKPSNVILDKKGRPKLLDFGLAAVKGSDRLTKTGSTLGTIGYMSPEQAQGQKTDQRSDLFSLGVVIYEMITGRRPFKGKDEAATLHAITHDIPQPLGKFCAEAPDELQRIVSKLLEKDPSLRYQNAADLVSDLKKLTQGLMHEQKVQGYRRGRRSRLIIAAITIPLAAIIVFLGYPLVSHVSQKKGLVESGEIKWANSIAVLPFRNFSPDKDQEYFCDGMTDALIGRLSGIEHLKVISMTSVLRYKTPDRDLKKIGRDLRVNTILEGSIQREDSRIRVSSQLINVEDDAHIWSDTYDRELASVFAIQDDISRAIVDAMKIKLIGKDTKAITRRSTENLEAYDFYMRGRFLWNKRTEDGLRKAIEYFEQAIALDSNYALAYSGLSDSWAIISGYSDITRAEALPKAKEAARKAVALGASSSEAHTSLAHVLHSEGNMEAAEKEYLSAIRLNPGYSWAHLWYSLYLRDMGRYQEEVEEEEIALELHPTSIPLMLNGSAKKYASFKWREAEDLLNRVMEIEPNNIIAHRTLAMFLAGMGRRDEAIQLCEEMIKIDNKGYKTLAEVYDLVGDSDRALWAANRYVDSAPDNPNTYLARGEIYAKNGMLDSAISSYKRALEIKPDLTDVLLNLGVAHMFRREYTQAESLYQVLAFHPDKSIRKEGRYFLAQIPLYQGKFAEGFRRLSELGAQARKDSLGRWHQQEAYGIFKRAMIYYYVLDDQESAIIEFEAAIKTLQDITPNSWVIQSSRAGMACSYGSLGNLGRAEELLRELKNDVGSFETMGFWQLVWSTGMVEMLKGNPDSAESCLTSLYRAQNVVFPIDPVDLYLARCYLDAEWFDKAVSAFGDITDRYEENRARWPTFSVMTHFWLGQAYEGIGERDRAIEQYETFLDIWREADSGLKPVKDAKTRVAHLNSTR